MKIESLDEALRISALTGLPLKVLATEKMLKMRKTEMNKQKEKAKLLQMLKAHLMTNVATECHWSNTTRVKRNYKRRPNK